MSVNLPRIRVVTRVIATLIVTALALMIVSILWLHYTAAPWTRDGQVRVQVANIAPEVSGQITELRVHDNEFVHKGQVLYVIDQIDYEIAVNNAQAVLEQRQADMQVRLAEAARREKLTTLSTSAEEKQSYAGQAKSAIGAFAQAQAALAQAKVNLRRTEVRSTVNGPVTNLLLRVGNYATAGTANIQVVDADSFWVDGYFEETKLAPIRIGDHALVALMGYKQPLSGHVQSITRGISTPNATPSTQGLPSVDPVYTWVRLAQRIPVRIHLDTVSANVVLAAGMTASVTIDRPSGDKHSLPTSWWVGDWWRWASAVSGRLRDG